MSTPKCPFIVVGNYMPPPNGHYASKMAAAILHILSPLGLQPIVKEGWGPQTTSIWSSIPLHAEVRRFAQPDGQGGGWHQDGDLDPEAEMDHVSVLWSEVKPTEFKDAAGKIWRPSAGEIVIAHNLNGYHRSPPDTPKPPKRRWFFRQRVHTSSVPSHLNLPIPTQEYI